MEKIVNRLKDTASAFQSRIEISDIRLKWPKFDDIELAAIKNNFDLVLQVQAKYGLDKNEAQTNVDAWANGRQF